MRSQFAVTDEVNLERYAVEQLLAIHPDPRIDWSVLPIIAVYGHAMHSGDLELAENSFDYLVANHSRLETLVDPSGPSGDATMLVSHITAPSDQPLVDWPAGMQDRYVFTNFSSIASSWVYYGLTTLAKIGALIDRPSASIEMLADTASALKKGINALQFNGTAVCDGLCADAQRSPGGNHTAFHSTIYALAFGALDDANIESAWMYTRSRIDPPFAASPPSASSPSASHPALAPTRIPATR